MLHSKMEFLDFGMEIPLALGTVGGLTNLHPLVKLALELLDKPSAKELMQIVAVAGLAQNFAATSFINYYRNPRRPYENAFDEYFESFRC